ncbi:MalY/PatB family protein [Clostridioides difficile]|uniref:cysteine-S-conjugate beta-lyase n=2 Tax=Clostridioides difficile TaxID=1496 RepID=A0AAX3H4R7_CLODI|nr:MalY/PatB family protein [Clostridioides difficile]AVD37471.1 pyridoxal phosphate-dependent aminotransferase [Clostridioides difficile]AVD39078.1 pyridoxal phosphate-dependent aminotransferase [Clostridioides difficile]AVD42601.1 pyridoxal phosphate-dependent aminotransferase [Clostridioides difficile]AXU69155.1 aminotransferase [Clostridioides difficile]AXU91303.1 aminotransferase [Clostridioides difficile]
MSKYNFDRVIDRVGTDCVKWDFRTNCSTKAQEDGLPFWIADMDFECAEPIIEALRKKVEHKIFGYSSNDSDKYFNAVCDWYKRRFNWEINRKDIIFSPGVVPAVAILVRILTNSNEGVIIQKPVYYPFEAKVKSNNREVVNNPLIYENGTYRMDYDDLEEKAKCSNNKVLILCSPHNPVGRVWREDELKKVVEICKKYDLWIIADEIHSDLIRKGFKHTPLQSLCPEYKDKIVTCIAPSKTFNLAGMQLSNIIVNNDELKKKYQEEVTAVGVATSPNPFAIVATIAAYNKSEDWLNELNEYLDNNIQFIDEYLKENLPKVKLVYPEGTYLAWLDFTAYGLNEVELEDLMFKKANVLFDEGYIFGKEGIGFERINVACPQSLLKECMGRLKTTFENL